GIGAAEEQHRAVVRRQDRGIEGDRGVELPAAALAQADARRHEVHLPRPHLVPVLGHAHRGLGGAGHLLDQAVVAATVERQPHQYRARESGRDAGQQLAHRVGSAAAAAPGAGAGAGGASSSARLRLPKSTVGAGAAPAGSAGGAATAGGPSTSGASSAACRSCAARNSSIPATASAACPARWNRSGSKASSSSPVPSPAASSDGWAMPAAGSSCACALAGSGASAGFASPSSTLQCDTPAGGASPIPGNPPAGPSDTLSRGT